MLPRRNFLRLSAFPALACFALGLTGGAQTADASSLILVFGQNGLSPTLTATASAGSTTLSMVNVSVSISAIAGAVTTPFNAVMNLTATSTSATTLTSGGDVRQAFSGNFSIKNADGTVNYLSGSFVDAVFGSGGGLTVSASEGSPGESVTFSSTVIANLGSQRAMSLSLVGVTPSIIPADAVAAGTLPSFTASVGGNFSATPEPSTLALAGIALPLVGFGYLRRRRQA